ncbi:replication initiation protein RepC [Agrobacterium larrymoorei]|uniref:Replication initiation protein RepC n=1 Tax=Agrobacterium larrymoorei TaxID=160699 RepID=A0AAJ2B9T3_9HYPH|nr:plasmid replication protein RepC [Agrobacterium larrymoorei]MDR6100727.1 replication initiation protein RepC [Agrobacterium larrymoorei]
MNSDTVTTPFGRRGVSYAQLAHQFASQNLNAEQSIDKWKLFRRICEARNVLGVSDRSLAVLNALLSFYPKTELSDEHGLVVFPSNEQLSLRAHGMSEQTLRRHLAALVDAGLILRKDSPNGKRYARKNRAGSISDAFGFSLSPLIVRSDEIEAIAEMLAEERLQLQRLREKISLCRRDIVKLIELLADCTDHERLDVFRARQIVITAKLDRKTKAPQLSLILEELSEVRDDIAKLLEKQLEIEKTSANAYQNERLIQSSESESYFEDADLVENADDPQADISTTSRPTIRTNPSSLAEATVSEEKYDLQTVLRACPEISLYGPGGVVRSWTDLKSAANVVKSMLSISQSAYDEAERQVGPHATCTIIACILERSEQINSAGGYLRSLIKKKQSDSFTVKPMLMALLRSKMANNARPSQLLS